MSQRMIGFCVLLLLILCVANGAGQKSIRYPQNAGDIVKFVEAFGRKDLSVKDVIKSLDPVNYAKYDRKDGSALLRLSPSNQTTIKRAVLDIFEGKPDRVIIEYTKPVSISYGTLKGKYGSPSYLRPPVYKCRPGVKCQPAFVGYTFRLCLTRKRRLPARGLGSQWT